MHQSTHRAIKRTEAERTYQDKLEAVRTAVDAWMQRSQAAAGAGAGGAAAGPGALSPRLAVMTESMEEERRAERDMVAAAAALAAPGGDPSGRAGADLRILVDKLTAAGRGAGDGEGAGGGGAGAGGGEGAARPMASKQGINVLRAAAAAIQAAGPLAPNDDEGAPNSVGGGGARIRNAPRFNFSLRRGLAAPRPPVSRQDSNFAHLPVWRRLPARWAHHWRVFRQQVDEDPEYADAVAHK
jgi:hypothetical protein